LKLQTIIILTLFLVFLSGCSHQGVSKDEKLLYKQIKNLEIKEVKRLEPTVISKNLHNGHTLDNSRVLDIQITPKNYKVGNNYIEAALSIWDYLYRVDNIPMNIGTVHVHGTGDVFFADVSEKYVVISRDQYELVKNFPREEAYKYFPIYEGYSAAKKRFLPCIEGFCHDEKGKKYKESFLSILSNLGTGYYIDFIEPDKKVDGIYWFFTYQNLKNPQNYSNYSIWKDEHSIYSVGIYDVNQKRIVDMKKIQDIEKEVKEWLELGNDETISDVDYTSFSNYLDQGSDYFIEFWISNKEGNAFSQIPVGLQLENRKIKLIQKEQ
jgi:hypothetical protein